MLKGIAFHDTNLARIFQLTITNAKFFQKNIPACRKLMGEPENFGRIITSNNKKFFTAVCERMGRSGYSLSQRCQAVESPQNTLRSTSPSIPSTLPQWLNW